MSWMHFKAFCCAHRTMMFETQNLSNSEWDVFGNRRLAGFDLMCSFTWVWESEKGIFILA